MADADEPKGYRSTEERTLEAARKQATKTAEKSPMVESMMYEAQHTARRLDCQLSQLADRLPNASHLSSILSDARRLTLDVNTTVRSLVMEFEVTMEKDKAATAEPEPKSDNTEA